MLGGLGGEQDAVFHRPDQPGRRIGVAGPPPGVPDVRDVAGEAGHPGQQAPSRSRQEVTHRPTLARTRMEGPFVRLAASDVRGHSQRALPSRTPRLQTS